MAGGVLSHRKIIRRYNTPTFTQPPISKVMRCWLEELLQTALEQWCLIFLGLYRKYTLLIMCLL